MATKVCSLCTRERPTSDYSNAQLKKKGKRVCTHCIHDTDGPSDLKTNGSQTAPSHSGDLVVAASAAPSSSSSVAPAVDSVVPSVRPPRMVAGSYPPNAVFGEEAPVAFEQDVAYYTYSNEATQLPLMTRLIERDLSEPYSVFTYRYFLNFWPHLTFMVSKC
jgi:hypothetical protein